MQNAGLDEAQTGIKIAGRNINNLRYAEDTTLMAKKWRVTEEPFDESEREEWTKLAWNSTFKNLDHGIRSHHFMLNRWGENGNNERL